MLLIVVIVLMVVVMMLVVIVVQRMSYIPAQEGVRCCQNYQDWGGQEIEGQLRHLAIRKRQIGLEQPVTSQDLGFELAPAKQDIEERYRGACHWAATAGSAVQEPDNLISVRS